MPTLEDARAELRRHRPELAIRMAEDIRAEAVASGARIGIAEADAFICTVFCVMQRPTEARSAAERALAEARQIGDDRLQAMAHCALSQLHFVSHETDAMETPASADRNNSRASSTKNERDPSAAKCPRTNSVSPSRIIPVST